MTLWEVDIYPAPGQPDVAASAIAAGAADLGLSESTDRPHRSWLSARRRPGTRQMCSVWRGSCWPTTSSSGP